jgi:hypothetical protein
MQAADKPADPAGGLALPGTRNPKLLHLGLKGSALHADFRCRVQLLDRSEGTMKDWQTPKAEKSARP